MLLNGIPRVRLACLPTPLHEMPSLTKELGGPKILVKRDDLTGLALGSQKLRMLEFILGDAMEKGANVVVSTHQFHTNWCTQVSAAARRAGLGVVHIKRGPEDDFDPDEYDGNLLLHQIYGADIKVRTGERVQETLKETVEELKRQGQNPYVITKYSPQAVIGYAMIVKEITHQASDEGFKIDYLLHSTCTGETQGGVVLGTKLFNAGIKVVGVSSGPYPAEWVKAQTSRVANNTAKFLGVDVSMDKEDVEVLEDYMAEGYAAIDERTVEAIKMTARLEGLILEPIYTGKAMAGLIDMARTGRFKKDETVLFWHTGGLPDLFPYREAIKPLLRSMEPPWKTPKGFYVETRKNGPIGFYQGTWISKQKQT